MARKFYRNTRTPVVHRPVPGKPTISNIRSTGIVRRTRKGKAIS